MKAKNIQEPKNYLRYSSLQGSQRELGKHEQPLYEIEVAEVLDEVGVYDQVFSALEPSSILLKSRRDGSLSVRRSTPIGSPSFSLVNRL
ncbi:MAG: hypothetical protein WA919_27220 [Coleofasciculaceae cyanobacterium]